MRSPYPEFVLTNIICIEKALKGTEIVSARIKLEFRINLVRTNARFYCTFRCMFICLIVYIGSYLASIISHPS